MKNFCQLTTKAQTRQNPDIIPFIRSKILENVVDATTDVARYVKLAMNQVDDAYTQKTKKAGECVKDHLADVLSEVSYEYQGSVMTDTHIKGHSDIDLLVICEKFYSRDVEGMRRILDSQIVRGKYPRDQISKFENEISRPAYEGNSISDLLAIRLTSETKLKAVYDIYDISKPKAIRITNKCLSRDVDIVVTSWYDDITSIINDKGPYRGISVFNKESRSQENPDYPFLSIDRINSRSIETQGRLKKMIRFLKTLKADSENDIELSSFDINAVCYSIDVSEYINASYLLLVDVLYRFIYKILKDNKLADDIVSVDGRECIFRNNLKKKAGLKLIYDELFTVWNALRDQGDI